MKLRLLDAICPLLPSPLRKSLARGEDADSAFVPNLQDLDFALIVLRSDELDRFHYNLARTLSLCEEHHGTVLQILGSLVFVVFTTQLPGPNAEAVERQHFVEAMLRLLPKQVAVIHGRQEMAVGVFGSDNRKSYTAVSGELQALLGQLAAMGFGEATDISAA